MAKEKMFFSEIQDTQPYLSIMMIRVFLGWIFFKAGTGKVFGWFSSGGVESTVKLFQDFGIPFARFNTFFVGWLEYVCGALLIMGLFTRAAVIPLSVTMFVAIAKVHREVGYYYPSLILLSLFILLQFGGGRYSLDHMWKR